ncbi:hypothetical protein GFY24_26430 [Nocardia sp. SYP-A9097]|uniref:hypothetical protein n=1 Tax=Nocardia sp. SYP-A9097 TaxID=2663237 RepID=UPI00129B6B36|nr:hypothetical protein [Nocardia sp. SYP-A9097]MRH90934.1 hypothetical protein [Nocardia sp. SYP-A9097]
MTRFSNRTISGGLAALAVTTVLGAGTGTAAADITLTPAADNPAATTVSDTPTGSGTGSATGSANILGPVIGPLLNTESSWAQANHLPDFSSFSAEANGSSAVHAIWTPIITAILTGSGVCMTCGSH